MKYLIIGLGNPGSEYKNTRHNIGFNVLDALSKSSNASFKVDKYADISEIRFKGRTIILIKPNTFMNLSGKSVNYWMQKLKIKTENILVISDDISLPLGILRMRKKGSNGGHNGLKDIDVILGNNRYARLRFGIGSDFSRGKQAEYVLSEFTNLEKERVKDRIELANIMIQSFVTIGPDQTMSEFNGK